MTTTATTKTTKTNTLPARPIAQRAVSDALANACDPKDPNRGVRETGGNNLGAQLAVYKRLMGYSPNAALPWCALFGGSRYILAAQRLSAEGPDVHLPAGFPINAGMNGAACAAYKDWAKKTGRWRPIADVASGKYKPRAGDIVIFDWDSKWGNDHFGIVRSDYVPGSSVLLTVEGNTRPGVGVSRESITGDGVWRKNQKLSAFGVGGGVIQCDF